MNVTYLKKNLMYRAATNAGAERLRRLRQCCSDNKSISTSKLSKELDRIEGLMKDDAVVMRDSYEALKRMQSTIKVLQGV